MGSLALRLVLRRSRHIGDRISDSGDNLVLFRRILLFGFCGYFVSNQFLYLQKFRPSDLAKLENKTYLQV
jgi:hypothetical protein